MSSACRLFAISGGSPQGEPEGLEKTDAAPAAVRPNRAHPLFRGFVGAAKEYGKAN